MFQFLGLLIKRPNFDDFHRLPKSFYEQCKPINVIIIALTTYVTDDNEAILMFNGSETSQSSDTFLAVINEIHHIVLCNSDGAAFICSWIKVGSRGLPGSLCEDQFFWCHR